MLHVLNQNLLVLIILVHLSFNGSVNKINAQNHSQLINAIDYLNKYGYSLSQKVETRMGSKVAASLSDAKANIKEPLERFQRLHHLKVTGELDEQTLKKISTPRCGLPDIPEENGIISSYKTGSKWAKFDLTYKVENNNVELQGNTRRAISEAFNYWSEVTPLKFTEVCSTCKSDLSISFSYSDHGDGYPFDGRGGTLAHAFFPSDGRVHFDEDEEFTEGSTKGTNLRIVGAHEIGHALGLDHSFVQGALMYPYYAGYDPNFKLHKDDIEGIQYLYGPRKTPLATTKAPVTTKKVTKPVITTKASVITSRITSTTKPVITSKTTTKAPITTTKSTTKITSKTTTKVTTTKKVPSAACLEPNKAVFLSPEKNIFVRITHNSLMKYDVSKKTWTTYDLNKVYPKLEGGFKGGVVDNRNITWFFKGRYVWAYHNYSLLNGYPKYAYKMILPRYPFAVIWKNNKMYLLKNRLAYEFDTENLTFKNFYLISTIFPGFIEHVDSAFKYNGIFYLFEDSQVYRFDEKQNKMLDNGKPRLMKEVWFPCF